MKPKTSTNHVALTITGYSVLTGTVLGWATGSRLNQAMMSGCQHPASKVLLGGHGVD